ncbi:hypothetical protein [Prauserella rugosa]|uniref:Uncharacterized protein n=1 Tax=Prauserella rugosa TaxID=43354 RepID=A0A660C4D2_9PSEU|nr:hypothetical protein [Prauserella rugosa]TWH18206.1 hypothetical protein JD82_00021 [Prauserella rugosa]
MVQPITAVYVREEEDYTVTVAGLGKEFSDTAPGIIAARDRADQLIEKIAPRTGSDEDPTVVHLLNGSALEFTSAYMTARLSKTDVPQDEADTEERAATEDTTTAEDTAAEDTATAEAAETSDVAEHEAAETGDVAEDSQDTDDAAVTEAAEDSEVTEESAESDVTEDAEAEVTAEATDDTEVAEVAEVAEDTDDAAQDLAGEGAAAAQDNVPGSAVPRKELATSPAEAVKETAEKDGSKAYAAAGGGRTAAAG